MVKNWLLSCKMGGGGDFQVPGTGFCSLTTPLPRFIEHLEITNGRGAENFFRQRMT